ncbi:MAG: DUF2878 family protein [Candidatus Aenigmarchaeota archaeon]|nr:DUF2878 family protein [Candidatus Aenigmarchaeota archaeon]
MISATPVRRLAFDLFLFTLGIAALVSFYMDNAILTALLLINWAAILSVWRRKGDAYFLLIGAAMGAAAEITAIHYGAWQYANPSFFGIPLWLPIAWGIIAVLIRRIAESVSEITAR